MKEANKNHEWFVMRTRKRGLVRTIGHHQGNSGQGLFSPKQGWELVVGVKLNKEGSLVGQSWGPQWGGTGCFFLTAKFLSHP